MTVYLGKHPVGVSLNNNNIVINDATTTDKGIIRLATVSEALEGINDTAAITPYTLNAVVGDIENLLHTINSGNTNVE